MSETMTPLELKRIAPPDECEKFTGVSWDTLRKQYPKLIRRISERRCGIRIADLITIGEDDAA
jgi:hypothetical protein